MTGYARTPISAAQAVSDCMHNIIIRSACIAKEKQEDLLSIHHQASHAG